MEKDVYEQYLDDVRKYKVLQPAEQIELADRIEKGDEKAKKRLIEGNLRLVISIAHSIAKKNIPIMDLIQEGNLGLMVAASKFRSSFNTRFSTYAYSWIYQYMLRYVHNKDPFISLPYRKNEMLRNIAKEKNYIFQRTGKNPSDEDIAASMNIPLKTVRQVLSCSFNVSSIDVACNNESATAIVDLLVDTTNTPEAKMMKEIKAQESLSFLSVLPQKEKQVIYYRYNFDGSNNPKTLREISNILGVSAETVRQMEMRAIRRMKKIAQDEHKRELFTA